MSDKTASTETADISASLSDKNSVEFSQLSFEDQVTEATCLRKRLAAINLANRKKAATSLRAIAHLLMSGSLGLLLTFSCGFSQQTDESNSTLPEQGRSEQVL